jgi:hypothetical protein
VSDGTENKLLLPNLVLPAVKSFRNGQQTIIMNVIRSRRYIEYAKGTGIRDVCYLRGRGRFIGDCHAVCTVSCTVLAFGMLAVQAIIRAICPVSKTQQSRTSCHRAYDGNPFLLSFPSRQSRPRSLPSSAISSRARSSFLAVASVALYERLCSDAVVNYRAARPQRPSCHRIGLIGPIPVSFALPFRKFDCTATIA